MGLLRWSLAGAVALGILREYIRHNDASLSGQPQEALSHSPKRYTEDEVLVAADHLVRNPIDVSSHLPPRTGRRYIVVGGAGFLGGWIILHLLARGEDPKSIRIVDICPPVRKELAAFQIPYFATDICDPSAVNAAFNAPWPDDADDTEITVFHTAAIIRFYERHQSLLHHSWKVNVDGTQNVINAARSIGVTVLVFTSSASVAVHSTRFWLWPWEKRPQQFVQFINDDDGHLPENHEQFFSNYAVSKTVAERQVRQADRTPCGEEGRYILRTGCLRPGNSIYGPGGDVVCEAYLVRRQNPCWAGSIVQSVIYVENCSIAHLAYEQRLIELSRYPTRFPDIGGQAFTVTDPGPAPTFGDVYHTLETLDSDTTFIHFSPTIFLSFAHAIELVYLGHYVLRSSTNFLLRRLAYMIPPISRDLISLQPSTFSLINIHLVIDDSRARLLPEQGGLGYAHAYTTLEGLCKTVSEHHKCGKADRGRSMSVGLDLGFIQKMGRTRRKR